MKKSDLKVGDRIIQITPGAGSGVPKTITDIDEEFGIIGMGPYGCALDTVDEDHKFVRPDGTYEDIEE